MTNTPETLNILNPDFRMPEHCGGDRWSILHGDSLQIIRQFVPNSFDAIITDPPYASGGSSQTTKNRSTNEKYSSMSKEKALPDFDSDQIIELAALRVERTATGGLRIAGKMDTFIKLPEGETLPENIVSLTGITDERLQTEGVQPAKAASQIAKLMQNGPTLMIAHNAQFDACFLRGLLRGQKVGRIDWLDSLTVYKDRRAYPHKLANAIIAYDLTDKVQNSHRAIDDVLALFEVLKAMDDEREDLGSYVNLFGYNPKYGVSGRRIVGVRYEPQSFSKGLTRPEQTLPARVARR